MLCSSSQFCSHYAHATIPIMPALCSIIQKPPIGYKSNPLHFRSTLSTIRNYGEPCHTKQNFILTSTVRTRLGLSIVAAQKSPLVYMSWSF